MKKLLLALVLLFVPLAAQAMEQAYRLNPGDELMISVWKEDDLNRDTLVLPDGTVSFPLVGQVTAEGLTPNELERAIAGKLRRYIPDAAVSVSVVKAAGHRIYVIGEVNRPGEYQPDRPLDVMQALSLAGGLTAYASEDKIVVLRRHGDIEVAVPFPYGEIKEGRSLGFNFELTSGDVVMVPGRSLF